MTLLPKDYTNISTAAAHLMGRVCSLKSRKVLETLSEDRIRALCEEAYSYIDDILLVLEQAEKRRAK